jgi:tetratricopeptide (TPR) repeat protein
LYDGLVLSQVEGEKAMAWSTFSEASRAEPDNYLPYLFGASCLKDTAGCLAQAVEINPHSLKSWILMGEEYARHGDIMKSIKCFESAAKIFPEYEIPYLRTAALLQKLGHKEESMSLSDKCKALTLPLQGPL